MWHRSKECSQKIIYHLNHGLHKNHHIQELVSYLLPRYRKYVIDGLNQKKRCIKKIQPKEPTKPFKIRDIYAVTTAAQYNFLDLKDNLEDDHFFTTRMVFRGCDVLYAYRFRKLCRPSELFFFRDGTTAIWNAKPNLSSSILNYVKQFENGECQQERNFHSTDLVEYHYDDQARVTLPSLPLLTLSDFSPETTWTNETTIVIKTDDFCGKCTISYGLAAAVFIDAIEYQMNSFISNLYSFIKDMKMGRKRSIEPSTIESSLAGFLLFMNNYCKLHENIIPPFQQDTTVENNVVRQKLQYCFDLVKLAKDSMATEFALKMEMYGILINVVTIFCKFALHEEHFDYLLVPFFVLLLLFNILFYI